MTIPRARELVDELERGYTLAAKNCADSRRPNFSLLYSAFARELAAIKAELSGGDGVSDALPRCFRCSRPYRAPCNCAAEYSAEERTKAGRAKHRREEAARAARKTK